MKRFAPLAACRLAPRMVALLALASLAAALAFAAAAADRRALVIGQDAYRDAPALTRAVADARAVAERLQAAGFVVSQVEDADRATLEQALSAFAASLRPGDSALFYYAGHGVEVDGRNRLLPIDVRLSPDRADLERSTLSLDAALESLSRAGPAASIAIIDACRDNPFGAPGVSGTGRAGLARIEPPANTFVMFSAGVGQIALDRLPGGDPNPQSVFAREVLPLIATPGLELRALAVEARRRVAAAALAVGHRQVPAYYDAMLGDFAFFPATAAPSSPQPAPAAAPAAPASDPLARDFAAARARDTPEAWGAFLRRHGARRDARVDAAFVALTSDARDRAAQGRPELADAEPTPAEPTLAERRAAQAGLQALGYAPGPIDGVFGPRTRDAIRRWRRARGDPATGGLSGAELAALLAPRRPPPELTAPMSARLPTPGAWRRAPLDARFVETTGAYVDAQGCARRPDGALILC